MRKVLLARAGYPPSRRPPKYTLPVCSACNNVFESLVERKASALVPQMLLGQTVTLDADDQQTVALMAIKILLMTTIKEAPRDNLQHLAARKALLTLRHTSVLPLLSVRLGYRADPSERRADLADHFVGLLPPTPPRIESASIGAFGHLVLEVLTGDTNALIQFMKAMDGFERFVSCFPPSNNPVVWPPPKPISRAELNLLEAAWFSMFEPGGRASHVWQDPPKA